MPCLECRKQINNQEFLKSSKQFNLELCEAHRSRMERLVQLQHIPKEAISLYYHLRSIGIQSMLAWWDGKQQIDLAISRVKLNISIDPEMDPQFDFVIPSGHLSSSKLFKKEGYSYLHLSGAQINSFPEETVIQIRGIIEELRYHVKIA